jgi:hypothetical protein
MARVERFEQRPIGGTKLHKPVTCGYSWYDADGERVLLLETYGSKDRKFPDKVSQSIQLDEMAARELKRLIERAFPGT